MESIYPSSQLSTSERKSQIILSVLTVLYTFTNMEDLVAKILYEPGPEQSPLPSIRKLAAHYHVSTVTIHKVLRKLQQQGKIFCIPSKGFYWGAQLIRPPIPRVLSISKFEQARARLFSDFQCGVFHPGNPLPTQQALAQLYGIAPSRLGTLLHQFVQTGVLTRNGRSFFLEQPHSEHSLATVLLISRCNADGQLLFNSERETDFMKALQRERMRLDLSLVVAGWCEERPGVGRFLDQNGQEFRMQDIPGVLLGAIVSSWLMQSPLSVLKNLWKMKIPVSVWWEHPKEQFPRPDRNRPSTVGFNISFGQSAGIAVGRYLNRKGYQSIAFISPFHASEWSMNRLSGLQLGFCHTANTLKVFTDSTHESAETFHRISGVKIGERMIRKILSSFIDNTDLLQESVWVTVNDHTAFLLIEILKEKRLARPYIISFDNSTIAESYRFDSFEFHTEGMVRQMLYHLQHPGALLYQDQGLHEMVGRLVIRQ